MNLEGIYTAIVTPFRDSGSGVDESTLKQIIELQIEARVQGIVVAGSTGEGQTLTREEWREALKIALSYRNQIQVLGACGSSGTESTRDRYRELSDLGVHAALISSPIYNRPPQRGIILHFEKIAASASLPIMVYNIPGRTAVNILPETMKQLWKIPQVIALKESSGNMEQGIQLLREAPAGKTVLSGDDSVNLAFFASGAKGSVSVASNLFPKTFAKLWKAWSSGEVTTAQKIQASLGDFIPMLFLESNPIPVKFCVGELLGKKLALRLPLVDLDLALQSKLRAALKELQSTLAA